MVDLSNLAVVPSDPQVLWDNLVSIAKELPLEIKETSWQTPWSDCTVYATTVYLNGKEFLYLEEHIDEEGFMRDDPVCENLITKQSVNPDTLSVFIGVARGKIVADI